MAAIPRGRLNKNDAMIFNDVTILSKKILVGFLIYLIPLAIVAGGLWLLRVLLTR